MNKQQGKFNLLAFRNVSMVVNLVHLRDWQEVLPTVKDTFRKLPIEALVLLPHFYARHRALWRCCAGSCEWWGTSPPSTMLLRITASGIILRCTPGHTFEKRASYACMSGAGGLFDMGSIVVRGPK